MRQFESYLPLLADVSKLTFPSTSLPQQSHPSFVFLANNSTLGKSPQRPSRVSVNNIILRLRTHNGR
jgi:hypothetical protein